MPPLREHIVLRRAEPEDNVAREALRKSALKGHYIKAFLAMFFQRFIFMSMCVALMEAWASRFNFPLIAVVITVPSVTAILIFFAVIYSFDDMTSVHLMTHDKEWDGWVAEAVGFPEGQPYTRTTKACICTIDKSRTLINTHPAPHREVVGTISIKRNICQNQDDLIYGTNNVRAGQIHSLVVKEGWRRLGVGTGLCLLSVMAANSTGMDSLKIEVTQLHPEGRAIFRNLPWPLRRCVRPMFISPAAFLTADTYFVDFEVLDVIEL